MFKSAYLPLINQYENIRLLVINGCGRQHLYHLTYRQQAAQSAQAAQAASAREEYEEN